MKKLIIVLLALLSSCSLQNKDPRKLPEKIADLPVGIEVVHSERQVFATLNKDYPKRGLKYKWQYQTTVRTLTENLKIIEFGGFILEENKWVERSIEHRPFNNQEFSDWYHCPNGLLELGNKYTDSNNWTTSDVVTITDSKVLWYFIGTDSENKSYVGYADIEMIRKLKE